MNLNRRQFLGTGMAPAFIPFAALGQSVPRVGLSLPLTGVQAEVASDLLAGYRMAFAAAASRGIEIAAEVVDDKSDPKLTAEYVARFGRDPGIIACSGIVGTPHAKAALPKAIETRLPVVGIRSGAQELRTGDPIVFHLRASYEDELSRMLGMIQGAGLRRLAVVYSDDAFGKGSFAHLQSQAGKYGVEIVSSLAAERNGADIRAKVLDAVALKRNAHALALLMISKPMLTGLRAARQEGAFASPAFAMSFTATRELAGTPIDYASGLGMVSAFPVARNSGLALAQDFRKWLPRTKQPESMLHSFTAFEGWMYGSVLADAVARTPLVRAPNARREGLLQALTAKAHNLGGIELNFDDSRVGYRHLEVLYKASRDGLFRS